jgi:hypothetical protein
LTEDRPIGPRADRVVEIRCPGESRGSGYLLGPDLVLTAAHVIGELGKQLSAAPIIEVVPLHYLPLPAQLAWPSFRDWDALSKHDIALLRIEPDSVRRAHAQSLLIGWEGLRTDRPLEVTAVGFPRLRRNPRDRSRDTEQLFGIINPLTALKNKEFEIGAVQHRSIDADRHGFSGAALFAGDNLIGIVNTKPSDERGVDFKAVRIDSPDANSEFHALIHSVRRSSWRLREDHLGIARALQRATKAFLDEYLISETGKVPFGGRNRELDRLDAWLSDKNAAPRMLVTAPAGRGKSALLVQWMKSLEDRGLVAEDGWRLVFFIPISIRVGTNRPVEFWGGLAHRLAEITGEPVSPEAVHNGDALKDIVQDRLESIASTGQHVLVVVDGLDEALQGSFTATIFPVPLPQMLRILLSARWQVGDIDSTGWLKRLGWDRNLRAETLELERLSGDAIADVSSTVLGADVRRKRALNCWP